MHFPAHSKQYVHYYNEYKVKSEVGLKQNYINSQIYNSRALH